MLFGAHARRFAFFGGLPDCGIYDNMKTAVTSVFTGKERIFNRRLLIISDHYMVGGTAVEEICRQAGISIQTYYRWRSKYGSLMPSEVKRLK